jgi:hypothetical protein
MQRACEADCNAAVKPQASEEIEGKAMSTKAFHQIAGATYRVHAPADIDALKIRRGLGLTREASGGRGGDLL